MHTIEVYIHDPTARSRYAVEQVLGRMLGWTVRFVGTAVELNNGVGPRLCYGGSRIKGVFHVVPSGFLAERDLRSVDPKVIDIGGLPLLFLVDGGDLPFDPFAASFFQLTRYEEWVGVPKDQFGRPITTALHASVHSYIDRPVVDEWALMLASAWRELDPDLPRPRRRYQQVTTIDLDNGFKYLGRPAWRTLGSTVRDAMKGRWNEIALRTRVLRGVVTDPYDVYEELREPLLEWSDRVVFFVLAASRGPRDHSVPMSYEPYAERIRSLRIWAEVGVHPSFSSSDGTGTMAREIGALQEVAGAPIESSRQHFLRSRIPGTMREVATLGIVEEHSMGLHDQLGFRAGTCTPYDWFDIEKDIVTKLTIHPFVVMDNTLRYKLGSSPEAAHDLVAVTIDRLKRIDGTFTGLWHESFLGHDPENKGWRKSILGIIKSARP